MYSDGHGGGSGIFIGLFVSITSDIPLNVETLMTLGLGYTIHRLNLGTFVSVKNLSSR